jgi:hypothetical protein
MLSVSVPVERQVRPLREGTALSLHSDFWPAARKDVMVKLTIFLYEAKWRIAKVAANEAKTISQMAMLRILIFVAQLSQNLALVGAYDRPATGNIVDCMGPSSLVQR